MELVILISVAADLLERTASTPAVMRAMQASLAPAFLLVGIGSIMNVMMGRLTWIAGRIERLEDDLEKVKRTGRERELEWLCQRRRHARRGIMITSAAAVVISLVIALLFVSAYVDSKIGTAIAALWVTTIGLLITGLVFFLRETSLAARGSERFRDRGEDPPEN